VSKPSAYESTVLGSANFPEDSKIDPLTVEAARKYMHMVLTSMDENILPIKIDLDPIDPPGMCKLYPQAATFKALALLLPLPPVEHNSDDPCLCADP
jgi:hypothetical protein